MTTNEFFDTPLEQSVVKTTIVRKYFTAWSNVISTWNLNKIAYIDLFAGPGRYEDGTESTPLLVLKQAIDDDKLRQKLVTIFNDKDEANARSLENAIRELPGIDTLKYYPHISCQEVGDHIVQELEQISLVPTLLFVDPWGYKGLSYRLIESVLQNRGSDCIFFFNYNRIRAGINNPYVKEHMDALFGEKRSEELRSKLAGLTPQESESTIIEELSQVLKQDKQRFVLPFRFVDKHGTRTSHYLIFVSKHFLGYEIMKDIMAKASTDIQQNVASFAYTPAGKQQSLLFELSRPLDDLIEMLLRDFAGQTLTMQEIYEQHSVDKPYIKRNYKEILLQLEEQQIIQTDPPKRRKNTFGDKVRVTFPPIES